mgnify:FL=1
MLALGIGAVLAALGVGVALAAASSAIIHSHQAHQEQTATEHVNDGELVAV